MAELTVTPPRCNNSKSYPGPYTPPLATPDKPEMQPRRPKSMAIALTGGPCSGKSTMLAVIRDRLGKRGIQVLTVPEYATHFFANSDGFQGDWVATEKEVNLQDILLRFQVTQENMFHEFAALNNKPAVLLMDRGVLDQKVFSSSDKVWNAALARNNVTEEQLLSRYDMVMHLGTCAKKGEYEWGAGSNNPGRYHNPDEAARLDEVCHEVYKKHKQLRMVPYARSFQDKVEEMMKYLEDALGVDGLAGKRQRVAVKAPVVFPADLVSSSSVKAFVVSSTYLDQAMQLSVRRRRQVSVDQWKQGLTGSALESTESLAAGDTFEERRSIPHDKYLARRVLHEAEYLLLLQRAPEPGVDKYVLSFQVGAAHYELFYFLKDSSTRSVPQLLLDCPATQDICLGPDPSLPQTLPQIPGWLEHEGHGPAAAASIAAETTAKVATVTAPSTSKRTRVLARNSTEEAAMEHLIRRRQTE